DLMHFAGADLQLDALLFRPDHRRMHRAVIVLLGRRDVILEPPGNDGPGRVHDSERLITVGQGLDDDAETEDVRQLLETDRFALHLAPNRIGAFATAADLGGNAAIGQLAG